MPASDRFATVALSIPKREQATQVSARQGTFGHSVECDVSIHRNHAGLIKAIIVGTLVDSGLHATLAPRDRLTRWRETSVTAAIIAQFGHRLTDRHLTAQQNPSG